MPRVLYITICTCLGFALIAYSLMCHYCSRKDGGKSCRRKSTICFPQKEQSCIKVQVVYKNRVMFSKAGCAGAEEDCDRGRKSKYGFIVKVVCCRSDMCNSIIAD